MEVEGYVCMFARHEGSPMNAIGSFQELAWQQSGGILTFHSRTFATGRRQRTGLMAIFLVRHSDETCLKRHVHGVRPLVFILLVTDLCDCASDRR